MFKQIFVNLAVSDLEKTKAFFTELGLTFNSQFTNENAACMIVSDTIFVMLLTKPFFKTFIKKEIADATISTEMLLALSSETKEGVDAFLEKVVKAGGKIQRETQDLGFMYSRSFDDLDGHTWEIFWMNPNPGNENAS